jgi:tetratricopeptide (TPR) repeat protein
MKHRIPIGALVVAAGLALGPARASETTIVLDLASPPAGAIHHPIGTTSREAQSLFDQGLALAWAFNHAAAIEAFELAAKADPSAPMPWWGIAYAMGPNINMPADPEMLAHARHALDEAEARAANGTPSDRAYIEALGARYAEDPMAERPALDEAYAQATAALVKRQPDDLDAKVLRAEALLTLRPWLWWTNDGKPEPGVKEAIAELRAVLKVNPDHIGANHFYVHAMEESPNPRKAMAAATSLIAMAGHAGHLAHMPAHIQAHAGDFAACAESNSKAIEVDEAYVIAAGASGVYPLMYLTHNWHFLAYCQQMAGLKAATLETAAGLARHLEKHGQDIPPFADPITDYFGMFPTLMSLRFEEWDRVLAVEPPSAGAQVATAFWHYARAVAYLEKKLPGQAKDERKALAELVPTVPPETYFGVNNKGAAMAALALADLDGQIAAAEGRFGQAIKLLEQAVAMQDALAYDDPPPWYRPVRESLGAVLLRSGRSAEAERVFRQDLKRNPGSGRSLWGLWQALVDLGKSGEADKAEAAFKKAWAKADIRIELGDL